MNEEIVKSEETIKIEDLLYILKKRWKLIFSITFLATITAAIISFYVIVPKYEATTKLFVGKEDTNEEDKYYDRYDVEMYQKLLKTYAEVMATNDLAERAIENNNLDITSEDVVEGLKVTPREDTQILEIAYTDTDKFLAKDVVDSVANEFVDEAEKLIPTANIKIIESVKLPEEPVSPNKKKNIAIAFLLGLMVSAGLSFLLEFLNNTFKKKEELEEIMGLPVIGVIPDELN